METKIGDGTMGLFDIAVAGTIFFILLATYFILGGM